MESEVRPGSGTDKGALGMHWGTGELTVHTPMTFSSMEGQR